MNTNFYIATKFLKLIPLNLLRKLTSQSVVLPFYHTVSNTELIHIKHLYQVKSEIQFERELDFLLQNFHPIDFIEYSKCILEGTPLKNRFLLTFDDGFQRILHNYCSYFETKGDTFTEFLKR